MKRQAPALPRSASTQDRQQAAEIDDDDRKDGAELDQHLEHPAGAVEAEEMAEQEDVGSRGNRQELGKAFDNAEDQRHKKTLIHVHPIP